MSKVIYLTGAPSSGKSSTTRLLAELIPDLAVWEYGERLTAHVMARSNEVSSQHDLRARSAAVVKQDDVDEVDDALIEFIGQNRGARPVIIDSHPVTKEEYGFRITAFSLERLVRLMPDEIWVLYASPAETVRRIGADAGGRPMITDEEARMHTALQSSVAATYGIAVGRPVHLFDTGLPRDGLIERMVERLA